MFVHPRNVRAATLALWFASLAGCFPDGGTFEAPPCAECMRETVRWTVLGELDAGRTIEREVHACREYAVFVRPYGVSDASARCTTTLPGCGETPGAEQLQRSLAHPDVRDALRRDRPFFGYNGSGTDLGYLQVDVGDRRFWIGEEHIGTTIPPGIRALREVLGVIERSAKGRCGDAMAP